MAFSPPKPNPWRDQPVPTSKIQHGIEYSPICFFAHKSGADEDSNFRKHFSPYGTPANKIAYYEIRGKGPPPLDIGFPGDIYVDLALETRSLYACQDYNKWVEWAGPFAAMHRSTRHPYIDDRYLYCSGKSFAWFAYGTIRGYQSKPHTAFGVITSTIIDKGWIGGEGFPPAASLASMPKSISTNEGSMKRSREEFGENGTESAKKPRLEVDQPDTPDSGGPYNSSEDKSITAPTTNRAEVQHSDNMSASAPPKFLRLAADSNGSSVLNNITSSASVSRSTATVTSYMGAIIVELESLGNALSSAEREITELRISLGQEQTLRSRAESQVQTMKETSQQVDMLNSRTAELEGELSTLKLSQTERERKLKSLEESSTQHEEQHKKHVKELSDEYEQMFKKLTAEKATLEARAENSEKENVETKRKFDQLRQILGQS